jgi:Cu/Ag efflux pump CusA
MNQIVKQEVNIKSLIQNSKNINIQSKLIDKINEVFTEEEQQWYITNLYIYMNYHPINDYIVNLENVWKFIGFANKGNAMKTIKNNFTADEDYKVTLFHTEKRKNEGGYNKEDVMSLSKLMRYLQK